MRRLQRDAVHGPEQQRHEANERSHRTPLTPSLKKIALDALYSESCVCGARKKRYESFCRGCYFALPAGLRNRLYRTMSEGYAEIYDQARDFLRLETDRLKNVQGKLL